MRLSLLNERHDLGQNPGRSLDDLKKSKDPVGSGWSEDEIINAMMPTIHHLAEKMKNSSFTFDDATTAGMSGVHNAAKSFKPGIVAFPTYAFRAIQTEMTRKSAKEARARNFTDQESYDGKLDWRGLKGNKRENLYKDKSSGAKGIEKILAPEKPEISVDKKKLIAHLLNSNSVGLSDIENLVVRGTYGIKKDGSMIDPISAIKMGEMLKVTGARISQIKTAAFAKITEYIKDRGIPTPEDAARKLDLEENKKR